MWEFLLLFLLLVTISGWYISNRQLSISHLQKTQERDYYSTGVHYLLQEQPEKATDIFMQLLESNQNNIDVHLALGNLFRRQGEIDKAIEMHQSLLNRNQIEPSQRATFLLELAKDYIKAGVLDRAESLLLEVATSHEKSEESLEYLMEIYQQSQEWQRAIQIAERLQPDTKQKLYIPLSHFYCELSLLSQSERSQAYLHEALSLYPGCARANVLLGNLYFKEEKYAEALKCYQDIFKQDPAYFTEVIPLVVTCYKKMDNLKDLGEYLKNCLDAFPHITLVLSMVEWIDAREGEQKAVEFLTHYLQKYPSVRGIHQLVNLYSKKQPEDTTWHTLQKFTHALIENKSLYRCKQCGFSAKQLHWKCPSCKRWEMMKPIQSVDVAHGS